MYLNLENYIFHIEQVGPSTDLDTLKVDWVHYASLEKLHRGEVPLKQAF